MVSTLAGCGGKSEKSAESAAADEASAEDGGEAEGDIEIGFSGDYLE